MLLYFFPEKNLPFGFHFLESCKSEFSIMKEVDNTMEVTPYIYR